MKVTGVSKMGELTNVIAVSVLMKGGAIAMFLGFMGIAFFGWFGQTVMEICGLIILCGGLSLAAGFYGPLTYFIIEAALGKD